MLVATSPFWMVGIAATMRDGEQLTARRVSGLIVGFTGIVLLVGPALRFDSTRGFLAGVMAAQIACAGWAVGSAYARRRRPEENVLAAAALEMLFGGLFLLIAGTIRRRVERVGVHASYNQRILFGYRSARLAASVPICMP